MSDNGHKDFEPEITAFMCIYCADMAADTAGALHIQYPANVKLVKMPCTGKTDVKYILDAFEHGADGVYVVGCSIGNCHHVRGNERARIRVVQNCSRGIARSPSLTRIWGRSCAALGPGRAKSDLLKTKL